MYQREFRGIYLIALVLYFGERGLLVYKEPGLRSGYLLQNLEAGLKVLILETSKIL